MKKLIRYMVGLSLLLSTASIKASPLCLKVEPLFLASNDYSFEILIERCEVCPWYIEEVKNKLAELKSEKEFNTDRFTSALLYLMGQSLLRNDSEINRARGREYIQLSFRLALERGFPLEEIIATHKRAE